MNPHTEPSSDRTDFQTTNAGSTLAMADNWPEAMGLTTVRSTLSPSLLQDLLRFSVQGGEIDLLHAMAASVRHGKPMSLRLDLGGLRLFAAINPRVQIFRAPLDLCALSPAELASLRLLGVEPESASLSPGVAQRTHTGALRPLLWKLALYGSREELFPEIAGKVRYRIAFGVTLNGLHVEPEWLPMLQRLKSTPLSLDELRTGGAKYRVGPQRMLNALYLQSGLMISRAFDTKVK